MTTALATAAALIPTCLAAGALLFVLDTWLKEARR